MPRQLDRDRWRLKSPQNISNTKSLTVNICLSTHYALDLSHLIIDAARLIACIDVYFWKSTSRSKVGAALSMVPHSCSFRAQPLNTPRYCMGLTRIRNESGLRHGLGRPCASVSNSQEKHPQSRSSLILTSCSPDLKGKSKRFEFLSLVLHSFFFQLLGRSFLP